eukprot:365981-Chlamydomonas_euryale.AAC.3
MLARAAALIGVPSFAPGCSMGGAGAAACGTYDDAREGEEGQRGADREASGGAVQASAEMILSHPET